MKFELPPLPFDKSALEPHMSRETMEYHHGKHHKAYVDKANALIQGTEFETMSIEDIIRRSSGALFNNSAQVWNHTFFWKCLTPKARQPQGRLLEAINTRFGSFDKFKDEFSKAAVAQFGSGWAWLVRNADGSVAIETTSNAENPLRMGKTALFTCDVWEHAYYIDYRNERPRFVQAVWNIVNWQFVESNFEAALKSAAA